MAGHRRRYRVWLHCRSCRLQPHFGEFQGFDQVDIDIFEFILIAVVVTIIDVIILMQMTSLTVEVGDLPRNDLRIAILYSRLV
jgi:hypothetical protein